VVHLWNHSTAFPDAASDNAWKNAFDDLILSNEGQRAIVEIGNLYPVNPSFAPPKGAPPFKSVAKKALPINWEKIKGNRDEIIKWFTDIVQK